jgi:putative hemolysin
MDGETWFSIALVLAFILIGGVFAGTEIALISLRKGQLAALERKGRRGSRVAAVARNPNRFLAAVQIGVTVAGFFGAAYGAATIAPDFVPTLEQVGLPTVAAQNVALVGSTLAVVYLSLVLGELVPKRIALQRSAGVALVVGPPLDRFASAMRPVIWLLSTSTNGVVRIFGGNPHATGEEISDEELRELIIGHEGLTLDERSLLSDVFVAADRSIAEVMRPRGEVAFVAADLTVPEAIAYVQQRQYSRYPVMGEGFDDILGFLHVRDLVAAEPGARVRDLTRPILELPVTNQLLPSLSYLRREGAHIALVVDEYGGTDGIVTLEDMVEELVGEIYDEYDSAEPQVRQVGVGRLSVEGLLTIEEFAERTGVSLVDGPYETVAGYVVARLGRLAEPGDSVAVDGHWLVVTEVARRRIVRLDVVAVDDSSADPAVPDTSGGDGP